MTTPTFDEITTTQFSDNIARVNALAVWIAATYDALEITVIQNQESDFATSTLASVDSDRAAIAAPLAAGSLRSWMDPIMLQIARVISSPETIPELIMVDLWDYMNDNTLTTNDPEDTYAAWGSVTGTGSGTGVRLTVDEGGFKRLGWMADTYTAECIADARQLGVSHEEVFRFSGTELSKDNGVRTGTGLDETIVCLSERDSARFVKNPGFEILKSTITTPTTSTETTPTTTTDFTGWTITTIANTRASVDVLYRTPPGSSLSYSMRFTDNNTITQDLVAVNNTQFDPETPYLLRVHVYRESSCDGTLTITLGGTSRAVTMTTLNNSAWNVVDIPATPGTGCWPLAFNANSLSLTMALASRTTGTLYLDCVILGPYSLIGGGAGVGRSSMGQYFAITGGATPFVKGDSFTIADSFGGTRGQVNYWMATAGIGYTPSKTGGTETWSD